MRRKKRERGTEEEERKKKSTVSAERLSRGKNLGKKGAWKEEEVDPK